VASEPGRARSVDDDDDGVETGEVKLSAIGQLIAHWPRPVPGIGQDLAVK